MSEEIQHRDRLGRAITTESVVAAPSSNRIKVCSVIKITNKMVRVSPVGSRRSSLKYPEELIVINGKDATLYMLKYSK